MWIDVRPFSTKGTVCRRNVFSGFSVCFLVQVWSSCSFHCKTDLELVPLHIYVWSGVCNWKETLCFKQDNWRTAFTHTYLSELSMWRDVRSWSTKGPGCRRNFFSGFSVCFLVPVWCSCSFHCKTELDLVPPHIYVWSGVCNWKETLCSQQASWRTALTHTFLSKLSMWRDDRSSSTKGTVCRRNFYSGFSVYFILPVWSSCSFHCKTELELVPTQIYVWSGICNWKESLCSQQARWRTAFTHTYLSELSMWRDVRSSSIKGTGCRETFTLVSQSVS